MFKWLKKLWEKIKAWCGPHFEELPPPPWPTPYILPTIKEGKRTGFGFSNNYIDIKKENRLFFDINATEEMDYDNPVRDVMMEVNGVEHYSGDIIPLTDQSVEMYISGLKAGHYIIRTDLVEYIPVHLGGKEFMAHHHVKCIYDLTVEE